MGLLSDCTVILRNVSDQGHHVGIAIWLFQPLNYAFSSLLKIRPIGYFECKCTCSEIETDEIFCCIEQG
jgi:hypothetical protein